MTASPDVLTERITLAGPGRPALTAYRARPAGPLAGRAAMIVTHELFGVTSHVREVCERLAGLGVVAVAPDLYHRSEPGADLPHDEGGRARGFELLHELTRDGALDDVAAVRERLVEDGAPAVGILGLSMGGHVAYLAGTALPLDPVIAAYPGWLTNTEIGLGRPEPTVTLTAGIEGRVLILTGSDDHAVPAADLDVVEGALGEAGIAHAIVRYDGVQHGFLCDRRDTFDPAAAADAWEKIGDAVRRIGAGAAA